MADVSLDAVQHLVGEASVVANHAHTRVDEVIRFGKMHFAVTVMTVVIATSMLVGGVFALLGFQRNLDAANVRMATAEKANADYEKQAKVVQDQIAQAKVQIDALSGAQAQKQQVIIVRDQKAAQQIAEVTKPDTTALQAATALETYNAVEPGQAEATTDGKVALTVPAAQQVTATTIERNQLKLDLGDTKSILADERQKFGVCTQTTTELTALNDTCKEDVKNYRIAAETYKRVAVKSKWKKFGEGAEKVLIFAAGIAAGRL